MSMWERPVDPGGLEVPGGAVERRDWVHVPRPPRGEARLLRITWLVSRLGGALYLVVWMLALTNGLAGARHGSAVFYAFCAALAVSLIGTIAHSAVVARADARALRVIAGRGSFAAGARTWPLSEIVGVVVDLDQGATRHTGVRGAASCGVAVVLREHLAGAAPTRDDRRDATSSGEPPTSDELLAAADRAFATATILQSALPDDAAEAAAALAQQLGVPRLEV